MEMMAKSVLKMYLLMMLNRMKYIIYVMVMEFVLNYFKIWEVVLFIMDVSRDRIKN